MEIVLARLKIGEFILGQLRAEEGKIYEPVSIAFTKEGYGLADYWNGMAKKNAPVPLVDVMHWTEPIDRLKNAYETKIKGSKITVPKNRLINLKDVKK